MATAKWIGYSKTVMKPIMKPIMKPPKNTMPFILKTVRNKPCRCRLPPQRGRFEAPTSWPGRRATEKQLLKLEMFGESEGFTHQKNGDSISKNEG